MQRKQTPTQYQDSLTHMDSALGLTFPMMGEEGKGKDGGRGTETERERGMRREREREGGRESGRGREREGGMGEEEGAFPRSSVTRKGIISHI